MKRLVLFFTIITAVVAFSSIAYSAGMEVTANVLASCSEITVPIGVDFGSYAVGADGFDEGLISVTCTNGTMFKIAIDYGVQAVGTQRFLRNPDAPNPPDHDLAYGLYLDGVYSDPWGLSADTYPAGGVYLTSTGTAVEPTVYGKLPLGQTQAYVGGYTDTVIISIDFAP